MGSLATSWTPLMRFLQNFMIFWPIFRPFLAFFDLPWSKMVLYGTPGVHIYTYDIGIFQNMFETFSGHIVGSLATSWTSLSPCLQNFMIFRHILRPIFSLFEPPVVKNGALWYHRGTYIYIWHWNFLKHLRNFLRLYCGAPSDILGLPIVIFAIFHDF